jgi:hypothetical protein
MTLRRLAAVLACVLPAAVNAQSTCTPGSSTSEAKLLAFFAGPLAFASMPGATALGPGDIAVTGELTFLPTPPSSITRSSGACGFNKAENSDLAPVFPRPRVAIGLGGRFVAEVSWLPPVTVMDATPHLSGIAVSWTAGASLPMLASAHLTLRAHATLGGVDGPITCPKDQIQNTSPSQPCFGGQPSEDTYEPNAAGVEAVVHASALKYGWHAGVGFNSLTSRLDVNYTDGRGFADRNVVKISLTRVALFGGVTYDALPKISLSAQVYSVPSDATTARLGLAWRLR